MAAFRNDTLEEDLTCSLCQDLFDNPKDLACPHVFCLNCLQDWAKAKANEGRLDTIICPECRQKTPIPEEGLTALKTNVRLRSLAEKYAARKANISLCNEHDEIKHFFCVTCGIAACHVCLKLEHESFKHTIKGLKDVSNQWKNQMKLTLSNVQEQIDKQGEIFRNMSRTRTLKIQKATGESLLQIKKRVQELVIDIQRSGDAMQAKVKKMEQEYMQTNAIEKSRVEDQEIMTNSVLASMLKTVNTAADHDYVTQHAKLMEQIQGLVIPQHVMPEINVEDFHFHPGPAVTPTIVGLLPIKICNATLIDEFGVGIFKKAQGIASTQTGLLAIADTDSNKVCVYQRNSEIRKYEFNFWLCSSDISGTVHRPFDVAVLSDGRMFVTSERQVKVFSSTGQFERSFRTMTKGPSRITSSDDGKILVADDRKKIITVHYPSGQLLRKYLISNTAINLATNGKMIAFTNQIYGNVCVIDLESGKEILNFKVGDNEATTGICFLDSCNSLLVSVGVLGETGKDRIEQYCCLSGKLITRVLTGLYAPMCLSLLKDDELAVADVGRVQVFSMELTENI